MYWVDDIVYSLSDEAWSYCIDYLYDVLGFRCIKKEDVRKIDVLEKLRNTMFWAPDDAVHRQYVRNLYESDSNKHIVSYDSLNDFLKIVHRFFESGLMKCSPGSKAEKYKNLVINKIQSLLNQTQIKGLDDIDDVFIVFLKFMDRDDSFFENGKMDPLENIQDVFVSTYDFMLIKKWFIEKRIIPQDYVAKLEQDQIYFKPFKRLFNSNFDLHYNTVDKKYIMTFVYICSILFLCRNLEKIDGFKEKEVL